MRQKLLRLPAVEDRTGLKRSFIYREIKRGNFPSPIKIGSRASVWPEKVIDKWIDEQINLSREAG